MASVPIRDMFEVLVPEYDRFNRWSSLGLDTTWRKELVRLLAGTEHVLDVGTGTGDLAKALVEQGQRVTAVDFSPRMIEAAMKKTGHRPSVDFAVASADNLPFEPRTFDGLCSAFVIRNLHEGNILLPSLREFFRVLKPGGQMVHLELVRPPKGVLSWGHKLYLRTILPVIGMMHFGQRWPKTYLQETIEHFPEPHQVCQQLRWIGFDRVGHYPLSGGIAALFVGVRC